MIFNRRKLFPPATTLSTYEFGFSRVRQFETAGVVTARIQTGNKCNYELVKI